MKHMQPEVLSPTSP